MKEDELLYIQGLMGKVDWEAFATKNQERLDKIKKVDAKVKEVKKLQKGKKEEVKEEEPMQKPQIIPGIADVVEIQDGDETISVEVSD